MRHAAGLFATRTLSLLLLSLLLTGAIALSACSSSDSGSNVIPSDVADTADVPAIPDGVTEDAPTDVPHKPDAFRPNDDVAAGSTGSPCTRNEDCESGWCVGWDAGYTCTNICFSSAGCPDGWECRAVFGTNPDVVFVCHPDQSHLCRPCAADFECAGGYCVEIEGEQRCTRPCNDVEVCPAAYSCVDVTSEEAPDLTSRQCMPTSGSCTCGPINVDKQRSCVRENDLGACWGAETCSLSLGWTGCSAHDPEAETCDGVDNDCDGIADNDLVPPEQPCETTWEDPDGVAADIVCTGVWVCRAAGEATEWRCNAPQAGPEACDRADNDCDGETDEGFVDPTTGIYASYENCGQCGISCEGAIPFADETRCEAEEDGARCVVTSCQQGYFVPPDFDDICIRVGPVANCTPCTAPDDCAGLPGTCFAEVESGRSYCAQNCPLGDECPDGFACTDGACRPLSDSCNCLAQHEGLTRPCTQENAFGVCVGLSTCDPDAGWSGCSARAPAEETCNRIDDDCDGQTDVGMEFPGGSAACEASNGHGTCTGSWICADFPDSTTGWLCTAPEPTDEACDRRDNDCDGETDEDFRSATTGHYVGFENCGVCGYSCEGAIAHASEVACDDSGAVPMCAAVSCENGYIPFGRFACIAAQGAACRPCDVDADCPVPGDRCLELDGARVCGQDCAEGNDYGRPAGECPGDFACVTNPAGLGAAVAQCLPASGSCTCLPIDADETRPCVTANEAGTCFGRETCDPAVGWTACDALTPIAEVCDGRDNNCNGLADEDVVPPGDSFECSAANANGTCLGAWVCAADGGVTDWRCTARVPAPDRCDYVDNDCDGATDEDYTDRDAVCFAGVGECRAAGVRECTGDGGATVCTAEPGAEGTETCNGRDDDCDGTTDEDWPTRNTPCAAGQGVCVRSGVWVCGTADPTAVVCNAQPGTGNAQEACDYQDDDCDGQTDETFQTAGRYASVLHCGACGNDCSAYWNPDAATFHAVPRCVDAGPVPSCGFTCENQWVDADGVASNGCELFADPGAIFVSVPAPDNLAADTPSCGSWNHPCATIQWGLQRASNSPSVHRVLVSAGAYEENVDLVEGIALLGGYNPTNWQRAPDLNVTSVFGEDAGAGHLTTVLAEDIRNEETLFEGFTVYGRVATDRGANSYAVRVVDCNQNLVIRGNRVFGGYGGPGQDGPAGGDGASGPSGDDGLPPDDTGTLDCVEPAAQDGGDGGAHVCGGTTVSGGAGADAVCPLYRNAQQPSGGLAPNGGGGGGTGAFSSELSTYCSTCFTPIALDLSALPTSGAKGAPGSTGGDGTGGAGAASGAGDVDSGDWTGDAGSTGVAGQSGRGGGGGGAGGGVNNAFAPGACPTRGGDTLGGTGGGGGAGGCGATGGNGGSAGGGAFAIFVTFSVAPGSLPVIEDNVIRRGVGGPGGRGGAGGRGGVGGDGGFGGPEGAGISNDVWCAGAGGDGGRGGDGGHGGGGGGGAGGVSYGVYLTGQGALTANWDLANEYRTTGSGGPGGDGGSAVRPELRGDAGPAGASGDANL